MDPNNTGPAVAADEEEVFDDQDSSLGTDAGSSTQSISSSILDYRHENGRTYHRYKDGKYNFPNDEQENERLDLQHNMWLLTFDNKLGLAPPNHPDSKVKHVLDVGTGTGIWAIDFADEHPEAKVVGADLSPIQPNFVPTNVQFLVDDIEEEWAYSEPFDYIHSRVMNFSIANWQVFIERAFKNLAPGGFLEIQEVSMTAGCDDDTLTKEHELTKWCDLLNEAFVKLGHAAKEFAEIKKMMEDAGFTDIVAVREKWPANPWAREKKYKNIGIWNKENMGVALEGITMAPFTRALGWSSEEVTVFLSKVRKQMADTNIHVYSPVFVIYGRKPEAAE